MEINQPAEVVIMKRNCSILFFFICGMILCAYNVVAQDVVGPKIFLKELVFDFGAVIQGETIEHVFLVANQGNEALEITKVSPD